MSYVVSGEGLKMTENDRESLEIKQSYKNDKSDMRGYRRRF